MANTASDYASEARSKAEDAATRLKRSASDTADKARNKLEDAGDTVREYSRDAADHVEKSIRKYPFGAVAGATLVGLVIGSILRR